MPPSPKRHAPFPPPKNPPITIFINFRKTAHKPRSSFDGVALAHKKYKKIQQQTKSLNKLNRITVGFTFILFIVPFRVYRQKKGI
jgi:hypothetical protein